ncbi:succinate dehydrogenase, cytochrome b556 subunit [Ostreibacterium oceani]|uniref:Succinate dehydrogenase cytochrome b556 subunit n=1 Tax=Ostreibacterium oceani TaxID=2654998 RepID=A0A6N7EWL8_9GAMM|nr:succinate dehydrogenase, cytochrome b556 subunit [Ostreibacterium oceani]MPV85940.1 succinate dehydrogenase, cytochrome b556 subunit [Ostreibacterium oceani]
MSTDNRPTSPHLQVYRWRITMLSSILHRATGLYMCLGLVVLVLHLATIAMGGSSHFSASGFLMNAFWFVWCLCIYFHLCNGLRYLGWDLGYGFSIKCAEKSALMALVGAVVLTVLTWLFRLF